MRLSSILPPASISRWSLPGLLLALLAGCAQLVETPQPEVAVVPASPVITRNGRDHQARLTQLASSGHAIPAASVGYFMDVHQARLLEVLPAESGISVERLGDRIRIILPGEQTFDSSAARVAPAMVRWLDRIATIVAEFDCTAITVNGHTDAQGDNNYNQKLSQQRALSVADTLAAASLDHRRLAAVGHGENHPIADNDSTQGQAKNRRIEIVITPIIASGPR